MKKSQATIQSTNHGTFAVAVDGKLLRSDFRTKQLASMWAARQGVYERKTPRRRQIAIPPHLEDESIKKLKLLAQLAGKSYARFLPEAKAGRWGALVQIGQNTFGIRLGDFKQALAAREIKVASK